MNIKMTHYKINNKMYYIFIWIYKITQTNQVNFTVFLDISFFVTEYFTV